MRGRALIASVGAFVCCGLVAAAAQSPAAGARAQDASLVEWDPWYVLAPIDQPGGASKFAEARQVEDELPRHALGKEGPSLGRVYPGKNSVVAAWRPVGEGDIAGSVLELGYIDLTKCVPPGAPTNDASAYIYRRVRAKRAVSVAVKYGFDDAARVWLNGKLVGEGARLGAFEPLAERLTLELGQGDNHLMFKVTNGGGAWRFRMLVDDMKALSGRAAAQQKVNQAIDRGCEFLIGQQLRDGSWAFEDQRWPGGQTALCVYALLKSGVSPKHQAIQRGIAYLKARPTTMTYTAGCTLLALWALHDPEHHEWMADITDELLSWQQGGMWAYPEGDYDLSNTQYAVLGLLAAARSGIRIPPKAWRDVLSQTLRYQGKSGGFGYKMSDIANPTGSMTAAGVSVLVIAKNELTEGDKKALAGVSVFDAAIEAGAQWLAQRMTISGSPAADPKDALNAHRGPYYLYGLERVCTLLGLERLGGSDWYWEGANWFLDIQGAKGDFPTAYGESESNTCFALLFLARSTASFSGPGVERRDSLYQTDDEKSDVWLRLSGDAKMAMWLGGFPKNIVEQHGWKNVAARGLHVAKVDYLIDGKVVASVNADASKAWNADKYSVRHEFTRSGKHRIAVRVHVMLEPAVAGGDPGALELSSEEVDVSIEELADAHLLEQAAAGVRNLVRKAETKAQASTQAGDGPASAACDARESSCWTALPEDKQPWISFDFEKPLRSNQVALSGLGGRRGTLGEWDRATRVELRINRANEAIAVTLAEDELVKTLVDLPRVGMVRSLEVRILERVTGSKYPGRVGFAEVELYFQQSGKR